MSAARRRRYRGKWLWASVVWSLVLLASWPSSGLEGGTRGNQHATSPTQARISVETGRLSVDLRQADLQTILTQIGEQAGISIVMDPKGRKTVSAEFTDVELEVGIRRLLRGASLSHTILYTQDPAGTLAIKEVRVFWDESGSKPRQPISASAAGNANGDDIVSHAAPPLTQTSADPPSRAAEGGDAAASFKEALELAQRKAPQVTSPAAAGRESEVLRSFRNLLQQPQ
jgi:hypothetical protein